MFFSSKTHRRSPALLFAVLATLLFSSCAAMFSGTRGPVRITANPTEGTTIFVRGTAHTPSEVPIELSKKSSEIMFSNPDYGDYIVKVRRKMHVGFIIMDILFTPGYGAVGLLIDGATGAWYKLPPAIEFDFPTAKLTQTGQDGPLIVEAASAEDAQKFRDAVAKKEDGKKAVEATASP